DTFTKMLATRPNARLVDVVEGDIEATLALVESIIQKSR
ncbi:MAG: hypothetical protein QOC57_1524, partial [Ilumatobacteraceae bacterium]